MNLETMSLKADQERNRDLGSPTASGELAAVLKQLDSLRLGHWKTSMEKDFSQIIPGDQALILAHLNESRLLAWALRKRKTHLIM